MKKLDLQFKRAELISNNNGGYIQVTLVNHSEKRVIKENFFLGPNAIKRSLISLTFWIRNLVKNNDESFSLPDPEYLIEVEGQEASTAYKTIVEEALNYLNTLEDKDITLYQEKVTGTDQFGNSRTYYNLRPWNPDQEINTEEPEAIGTFKGFI